MIVKNNYNECITNLACSIRKYFKLDYKHNTIEYIDKILEEKLKEIKLKKSSNNEVDDTNLLKSYLTLKNILAIIFALGICLFVINLYVKMSDLKSKIIFLPVMHNKRYRLYVSKNI